MKNREPNLSRRRFLKASGLGMMAAAAGSTGYFLYAEPARAVTTSARIAIVGGGAAGLAMANRLAGRLQGATITVIEGKRQHVYQPGLTMVATGYWQSEKVVDRNSRYMPSGVEWVESMAAEVDPDAQRVITEDGGRHQYDYLVVATGLHLDFEAIEGMSADLIGEHGIGCVYDRPDHAVKTERLLTRFMEGGEGVGVFTRPPGALKCAGAPLKMTMLAEDAIRRHGVRDQIELVYTNASEQLFSQPDMDSFLKQELPGRDIHLQYNHSLKRIEPESRRAIFETPDGETTMDYDFIHVVPPMRAPDVVGDSPLAWQEGRFAEDGNWLEVDRHTMRHRRFPNVFGVGDCVGTPVAKTAASVKAQVPVAVENLMQVIQDREETASYNGYTSCPLITRRGQAILVEFDYELNMVPSFPFISPYQEHWIPWVMKDRMLQPAYNAMLRGRV